MLRFGLIGAGRIGVVHARSIASSPDAELRVVADPDVSAAERLAAPSGARVSADPDAVFAAADVDAVIIGSPTRFHVDHILAAVSAGAAVFVEKPIDLDLARADECLRLVGSASDRVMVGFNRRFDPSTAALRERVLGGEIGPLEQLTITSRDPSAPSAAYLRGSGGIFRDMTIHDFDTARSLMGEIVEVAAVGQHLDPEVDDEWDAAVVSLRGATGAVATVINSRHCATGYDQRIEAFGPAGSLRMENVLATTVRSFTASTADAAGPWVDFFLERYRDAYAAELDHFIAAVRAGAPLTPTLHDGRAALALAEAAALAARTGTRVPVPVADRGEAAL